MHPWKRPMSTPSTPTSIRARHHLERPRDRSDPKRPPRRRLFLTDAPTLLPPSSPLQPIARRLSTRPPRYRDFQEALYLAGQSPQPQARHDFIRLFNTYAAPRLRTEEAACQFLAMHTSYLYLEPGMQLCMNVEADLFGQPVGSYASRVAMAEPFIDAVEGGMVSSFMPCSLDRHVGKKNVVIVPGGTAAGPARDVLSVNRPTGLRADVDRAGIAHSFVAANKDALLDMVRTPLARGQEVVFAGHSLGGAIATRMMAALEPAEQRRCKLLTFNGPALDVPSAQRLVEKDRVRMVRSPYDLTTRVGEAHPQGCIIVTPPTDLPWRLRFRSHGVPLLAMQQLDGKPFDFRVVSASRFDTCAPLEMGRKFLGRSEFRSRFFRS